MFYSGTQALLGELSVRLALRGFGRVEPNPMVGCVICAPDGRIIGMGHHARFGGAHAEIEALRSCARQGADPRGATVFVTLEPCAHHGKTPPCAEALIEAGVARVVIARRDPHAQAQGGAARLREAGVEVVFTDAWPEARWLSDPFVKRVETGLPWVVAKWAQTIDGRIATRSGASQWISGERSRRWVHLLRGRVDAVVTGVGTVLADDPRLTARGAPVRRVARRVVIDPDLRTPAECALVRTIGEAPLTIACAEAAVGGERASALRHAGVEVIGVGKCDSEDERAGGRAASGARGGRAGQGGVGRLDLAWLLRRLVETHGVSTAMVEAGPGVTGSLLGSGLVDAALVFIGPRLLADAQAPGPAGGLETPTLEQGAGWRLSGVRRCGEDVMAWWSRDRSLR